MPTLQVHLPEILPRIPDSKDRCVQRLQDFLQDQRGVLEVYVEDSTPEQPAKICVHYEPEKISLVRLRELIHQAGAELTQQYTHCLWKINGLLHQRRARSIAARLRQQPGVIEAEVTAAGWLRLELDVTQTDEVALQELLLEQGIEVLEKEATTPPQPQRKTGHHGVGSDRVELGFSLMAGLFLGLGWVVQTWHLSLGAGLALYLFTYFFGGFFTFFESLENLRNRRLEIDSLMLLAAIGAAFLGQWAEGGLLLFLFSMGHALEHYAMGRARQAIESLAKLAPKQARVLQPNQEILEVPVEDLTKGDIVLVQPNERLPADGFVVRGQGNINQAAITGESMPVEKQPVEDPSFALQHADELPKENCVFAGTINGLSALEIQVTKTSQDSTLARIVKMVTEAETQESPTQRFTDIFERYFVPTVLIFVGFLLFSWVIIDEPLSHSFYRAMAVLVAASPCALAIATPSAVLSGIARAGQKGVLIKGGGPLENLGTLRVIAFDKTGTLTRGKPELTDVLPLEGVSKEELLRLAVAVEKRSDHPLAAALVKRVQEDFGTQWRETADKVKALPGRGVQAILLGKPVLIGKIAFIKEQAAGISLPEEMDRLVDRLEKQGRTTMVVQWGEKVLGVLGFIDQPRPAAVSVIQELRSLGIRSMMMISGDNQRVVDAVAQELGLDEAYGDLLPEGKVAAIQKVRKETEIAMVGDGVNDAPAMAHATVGIAMGAAGSDVALETADVALMADQLEALPFAVGLSRQTKRIIQQNLWISLGMVAFLVPITLAGLPIAATVVFHEGSTLAVVLNALRLLRYKKESSLPPS